MARFLLLACLLLTSVITLADTLRVGMSVDYPPLTYLQDGEIVGVEADNVRAVGSLLNKDMQIVRLPFVQLIPALLAGEIDVIMSGMSATEERSEQVLFCDPYMEVGQMAIMHRDKVAQFGQPWAIYRPGIRVGVEPGTTGADFAARELGEVTVKEYAGPDAAFDGLRADEIDLFVHDAPTSWQLAKTSENDDLISLYSPLTSEQLAWAVRKDDTFLADNLNRALRTLRANGTLNYILNRWIPVRIEVR